MARGGGTAAGAGSDTTNPAVTLFVGLAIGVVGTAAVGRVLNSLVFGVTSHDAATFVAVSVLVFAVGLLSSVLPAYRATCVDPLQALRAD